MIITNTPFHGKRDNTPEKHNMRFETQFSFFFQTERVSETDKMIWNIWKTILRNEISFDFTPDGDCQPRKTLK